ncbi:MAG: lipase maturation factor family protein, partial [Myxococcota bacterium]
VLCVPLLDDEVLDRAAGVVAAVPGPVGATADRQRSRLRAHAAAEVPARGLGWAWPVAAAWAAVSLAWFPGYRAVPPAVREVLAAIAPLRTVNPYGLFAVMTTDRIEVVFEGSWDHGATWRELPSRYRPGPVDRVPPQVAPHMPRIDWQLWFAGLGTCRENPWVIRWMQRVVDGSPAVLRTFADGTFDDGPPDQVRAEAVRYTFAPPGAPVVWEREDRGPYCAGVVGD